MTLEQKHVFSSFLFFFAFLLFLTFRFPSLHAIHSAQASSLCSPSSFLLPSSTAVARIRHVAASQLLSSQPQPIATMSAAAAEMLRSPRRDSVSAPALWLNIDSPFRKLKQRYLPILVASSFLCAPLSSAPTTLRLAFSTGRERTKTLAACKSIWSSIEPWSGFAANSS